MSKTYVPYAKIDPDAAVPVVSIAVDTPLMVRSGVALNETTRTDLKDALDAFLDKSPRLAPGETFSITIEEA